ncbi:MAG: DUF1826 domain-containing protein [Rhodothalassiaceae bacterium]
MIGAQRRAGGAMVGSSAPFDARIGLCDTADGLAAINDPGMDLVIWRRALPVCLQTWLDRLDAACLPDIRLLVEPCDLRPALEPDLDACGMPAGDMRDGLVRDVEGLAHAFCEIARSDCVDVRLERVGHDACWKFHRDCVEARLLTTYRGPATEWVPPTHSEQALREQKRFNGPIEHLRRHDVAIFKGSCAGEGSGIVHRSPPILGTGQTRLLLVLNTPSLD